MLAAVVSLVDRLLIGQLVEPIRRDLNVSDFEVSLLQGLAFSLTFVAAGIPIGRLVDRSVRRNIVAAGVAFWSLMTAAGGLATYYWQLFLSRLGVGVGEAALGPAAYSIISDYFTAVRVPMAIAVFALGTALGSGLSFVVGSLISDLADKDAILVPLLGPMRGWQVAFVAVGLPGLIVAALVLTIREPARRNSLALERPAEISEVTSFVRRRKRLAVSLVVGVGSASTVSYALLAWMTTFFIRVHAAPAGELGPILGALVLSMSSAGIVGGGYVASILLKRGMTDATLRTAMVGMFVASPLLVAAPLMPTMALSIAAFAPAVLFSSVFVSLGISTIQLVTPNEMRGQLTALGLMLTTVVGSILGPSLVAACTDYVFASDEKVGYSLALVCGAMSLGASAALALSLRPLREAMAEAAAR